MQLFTEDATVNTYFGDTLFASMRGREEIGKVFSGFIANFSALYHMNGQMITDINGDHANSTHYCLVVLVSEDQGKEFKNFNGVIYKDEYIRRDGQWLITNREARFAMWLCFLNRTTNLLFMSCIHENNRNMRH